MSMDDSRFTNPVSFNGATGVPIDGPINGTSSYKYKDEHGDTKYFDPAAIERAANNLDEQNNKKGGKNKQSGERSGTTSRTKKSYRKSQRKSQLKHKHKRSGTSGGTSGTHKSQRRRH